MIQKLSLALLCFSFLPTFIISQIKIPKASPKVKTVQEFALSEVTFNYSAPSAKGRKIFGSSGLIKNGEQWRTGANAATKITFKTDTYVKDILFPKGQYSLITIPGEIEWTINWYEHTSSDWTEYKSQTPRNSFKVKPKKLNTLHETLQFGLEGMSAERAFLYFQWEYTKISLPIYEEIHEGIMKKIDLAIAGTSLNEYFQSAIYLHDSNIELDRALEYVRIVTSTPKIGFFPHYKEALILKDLNRFEEAKLAVNKSKELAIQDNNLDFVKLCEALLDTLK